MRADIKKRIQDDFRSGKHTAEELSGIYGYPLSSIYTAIRKPKVGVVTSAVVSTRPATKGEKDKIKWREAGHKAAATRKRNKMIKEGLIKPDQPVALPVIETPIKESLLKLAAAITELANNINK